MKKALYIGLAVLAVIAWRDWQQREIIYEPGILVPEIPRQTDTTGAALMTRGAFQLTRRAAFEVRARVLSIEKYSWGEQADLSPFDFALGWGVMSDQSVLDRITIRQGGRWYYTRYELPAPVSDMQIIANSSNMHMVPANDWVRTKLSQVRKGDILQIKGFLIDVDAESGFFWRTSLRRDDTGNGSCEIFYVENLFIEER